MLVYEHGLGLSHGYGYCVVACKVAAQAYAGNVLVAIGERYAPLTLGQTGIGCRYGIYVGEQRVGGKGGNSGKGARGHGLAVTPCVVEIGVEVERGLKGHNDLVGLHIGVVGGNAGAKHHYVVFAGLFLCEGSGGGVNARNLVVVECGERGVYGVGGQVARIEIAYLVFESFRVVAVSYLYLIDVEAAC